MTDSALATVRVVDSLKRLVSSIWFKLAAAVLVLLLLLQFNRLNFDALGGLGETWLWLVLALALMLPPFLIVSYRFRIVLRSQGFDVPFAAVVRWTMVGSFFDLAMPSSNGGDVIKAGYVMAHAGAGMRTRAVMAVAIDRVLGLLGLFLLASVVGVFGWSVIRALPAAGLVLLGSLSASVGALATFRVLGARRLYNNPRVGQWLSRGAWGPRLRQIIGAFNDLRERPFFLFAALGLSMVNHVFWCAALLCIARAVGDDVDPVKGFVVFPMAIFGNVFGVAGGFGLGTAVFDLFLSQLLGIGNGALIGLLFQTLSALTRLAGMPFYFFTPRSKSTASMRE